MISLGHKRRSAAARAKIGCCCSASRPGRPHVAVGISHATVQRMVVGLVDPRTGGRLALTEQGRAGLLEATPPALASSTS
jgi:hypothetical protein